MTLGSHSFIDTFEDQIAGHKKGDEFDVNVTFPENYGAANLSGKPALFKVKVNSIKRKEEAELLFFITPRIMGGETSVMRY